MEPSPQNVKSRDAPASRKGSSLLFRVILLGVGLCMAGWLFRGVLWEIVKSFMINVLPIVLTPVILELSIGFVGLFIVLLFCHLRRKDQEDEWVYISQVEPEAEMESIPEPLRKRVSETVLKSKPDFSEADELPLQAVEGFIELGLLEDAANELAKVDAADHRRPAFVRLHLMLMLRREQWQEAEVYADTRPAPVEGMAENCVEVARFFVRQKPSRKDPARQCLELGKKLSVNAVVNAIDADGRLQKLA